MDWVTFLIYAIPVIVPCSLTSTSLRFQNTPLHFAAEMGHLGCLRALLGVGFETNAQNEDDKCALHMAASHGRKKCAMELVKKDKSTVSGALL